MAKLAIKWTNERDNVSKFPQIERAFEKFCAYNDLLHEARLGRAMLNYSIAIQEKECNGHVDAVKCAFAFCVGYAGANGVSNSDMAEIIGLKDLIL